MAQAEAEACQEPPYSSFDNSSSCESLRPVPRRINKRRLRDLPDLPPGRSRMFPFNKRQLSKPNLQTQEKSPSNSHRSSQAPTIGQIVTSKKTLKHKTSISDKLWHMFQHDRTKSQGSGNSVHSSTVIVPTRPQHPPLHLCPSVETFETSQVPKTSLPALKERVRTRSEPPLPRPPSGWRRFSSSFEFPLPRQKSSESTHTRSSSSSSNNSSDLSTKRDSNSSWSQISSNLADGEGAKNFLELFQSHSRSSSTGGEPCFIVDKLLPDPDLLHRNDGPFVHDKLASGLLSSHAELQNVLGGNTNQCSPYAKPEDVKAYLDTLNAGLEHVKRMGETLRLKYMQEWEERAKFGPLNQVAFPNDISNSFTSSRAAEQRYFPPFAGEKRDKGRHKSRDLSTGTSLVPIRERPTAEEVAALDEVGSPARYSGQQPQESVTTNNETSPRRISRSRRTSGFSLSADLVREPSPPPIQPRNPLRLQKSKSNINLKTCPGDDEKCPDMPTSQTPQSKHVLISKNDFESTTPGHSLETQACEPKNNTSAWTTFASPGIKSKLDGVFERLNTASDTYPGAVEPSQLSKPRSTSGLSSPIAKRIFATVPNTTVTKLPSTTQPTSSMFTNPFMSSRRVSSSADNGNLPLVDRRHSRQSTETMAAVAAAVAAAEKSGDSSVDPTPISTPTRSPTVLDFVLALRSGGSNRSSLCSTYSRASFDLEKSNNYVW